MRLAGSEYDVFDIPISEIFVDPEFNCRRDFSLEAVRDLAGTIELEGLLFPVVVRPREDGFYLPLGFKYGLVCGFRRTAACKSLGWQIIPANVRRGLTQRQAALMNLTENIERLNLNILEEAIAIETIFPTYRTDQSVATELKKGKAWVSIRRKLMTLSEKIQQCVASGRLTYRDLQKVVANPEPDRVAEELLKVSKDRRKFYRVKEHKKKPTKAEIQALITKLLAEGFNPNILRLIGWTIGEVSDEALAEARRWLRDRRTYLK